MPEDPRSYEGLRRRSVARRVVAASPVAGACCVARERHRFVGSTGRAGVALSQATDREREDERGCGVDADAGVDLGEPHPSEPCGGLRERSGHGEAIGRRRFLAHLRFRLRGDLPLLSVDVHVLVHVAAISPPVDDCLALHSSLYRFSSDRPTARRICLGWQGSWKSGEYAGRIVPKPGQ